LTVNAQPRGRRLDPSGVLTALLEIVGQIAELGVVGFAIEVLEE
jgi:hypothetical protein